MSPASSRASGATKSDRSATPPSSRSSAPAPSRRPSTTRSRPSSEGRVAPGALVAVPLGPQTVIGVVLELRAATAHAGRVVAAARPAGRAAHPAPTCWTWRGASRRTTSPRSRRRWRSCARRPAPSRCCAARSSPTPGAPPLEAGEEALEQLAGAQGLRRRRRRGSPASTAARAGCASPTACTSPARRRSSRELVRGEVTPGRLGPATARRARARREDRRQRRAHGARRHGPLAAGSAAPARGGGARGGRG